MEVLQHPKKAGGLAVLNPGIYFLVSQLQQYAGWDSEQLSLSARRLFSHVFNARPPLQVLERALGGVSLTAMPTIKLMCKIWDTVKKMMGFSYPTRYTPIWGNDRVAKLLTPRVFRDGKDLE